MTNGLLISGDYTKKLRDVMAAQLLCRCKYLCMLKLRILPHLQLRSSIYTAYTRLIW